MNTNSKFLKLFLLLCLISSNTFALTKAHEEILKNKKEYTYEDLQHENPHCPENSLCSKESGKKVKYWNDNIGNSDIKTSTLNAEKIRKKLGLPVQFLTFKNSQKSLDPILWNSRCKFHNPKDKDQTVYKATKFFRNDPKSKLVNFVPLTLKGKENKFFNIPYGAQPLLLWNNKIFFIHEYQDALFHMSVSDKGKWKAEYIPKKLVVKAREAKENVQCQKTHTPNAYFSGSYCTKILNIDTNTMVEIEQSWSCP